MAWRQKCRERHPIGRNTTEAKRSSVAWLLTLLACAFSVARASPSTIDAKTGDIIYGAKEGPTFLRRQLLQCDAVPSNEELLNCTFSAPKYVDHLRILRKLYGPLFEPTRRGSGQLLLLGHHNSGTSILSRLIMLMGAFAGNLDSLSTSPKNRLKYWEKLSVSHFHELALGWVTDSSYKPYQMQGVDMSRLTDEMAKKIRCFARRTIADLNRHRPWIVKDPRMLLFTKYWISQVQYVQMRQPVCIITYRDPLSNAVSLMENSKKSDGAPGKASMTVKKWLSAWQEGMLAALWACRTHPTLVVYQENVLADLELFLFRLLAQLGQAGVEGLQMPNKRALNREVLHHIKLAHRRTEGMDTKARLNREQAALYMALQMVANAPDNGLSSAVNRADIVLRLYQDTLGEWKG